MQILIKDLLLLFLPLLHLYMLPLVNQDLVVLLVVWVLPVLKVFREYVVNPASPVYRDHLVPWVLEVYLVHPVKMVCLVKMVNQVPRV